MKALLRGILYDEVDATGLGVFRILFGGVLFIAVLRFIGNGWVDSLCSAPPYHFTYWGFGWVHPWPGGWMMAHFLAMAVAALTLALGFWSRLSAAVFFALFTYVELIDKANYLNHYYLVSIIAALLVVVPAGADLSLDSWRRGARYTVPRWCYLALMGQVGIVYFYAGLAKLDTDWLWRAEPLRSWFLAMDGPPALVAVMRYPATAHGAAWFGAIYDLTAPWLLAWRRSRPYAFLAGILFHGCIGSLFPVGMFSLIMVSCVTIFFSPNWPRKSARWLEESLRPRAPRVAEVLATLARRNPASCSKRHRGLESLVVVHLLVQLVVPLRFLLYPGQVNWTEQGFRFAWRVMLIEKSSSLEFQIETEAGIRRVRQSEAELTPLQWRMMSTQPDMIQQYARRLADLQASMGEPARAVRVRAAVSLNGRPSQWLIHPSVDLAGQAGSLNAKPWILPLLQDGSARRAGEGAVGLSRGGAVRQAGRVSLSAGPFPLPGGLH